MQDCEEGWHKFAVLAPDVTLLDVNMPYMSGFEVLQRIRDASGATGPAVETYSSTIIASNCLCRSVILISLYGLIPSHAQNTTKKRKFRAC